MPLSAQRRRYHGMLPQLGDRLVSESFVLRVPGYDRLSVRQQGREVSGGRAVISQLQEGSSHQAQLRRCLPTTAPITAAHSLGAGQFS